MELENRFIRQLDVSDHIISQHPLGLRTGTAQKITNLTLTTVLAVAINKKEPTYST
jgi:hypothetical protein